VFQPRPSHRIMTLDPRESEDIEMYLVAWLGLQ
jgi:hypothetical protein